MQAQQAQNPNPNNYPMVALEDIKITGVAHLHELMTRNGHRLPHVKSRFVTLKHLLAVREGKIYGLRQKDVNYMICTRPPSARILCEKLHSYLALLGVPSGICMVKENFPDKEWLVLAVGSLSRNQDEIFAMDYVPASNELRRIVPAQILVHNNDGLLNIPQALMPKAGGKQKYLRMVVLTKEEKIQAKIALGE